jgi:hypothetical protein
MLPSMHVYKLAHKKENGKKEVKILWHAMLHQGNGDVQ